MSKNQRLWCTHAPLRSALFSNLMFPPSIFFSRMLCCDTPMTLDLGCPAVLSSTRNRGHRMGERTPYDDGAGGRLAAQEKPAFLGACARLHGEPYILLVLRRFVFSVLPSGSDDAQMDSSLR